MNVALVIAQVEVGFVVAGRLVELLAQPVEIAALSGLNHIGQNPGNAFAHSLDRGQAVGALQRENVRALERERPRGGGESLGPKPLLGVLAEQVADLGQNLRRLNRIQPVNCVSNHGSAEAETR